MPDRLGSTKGYPRASSVENRYLPKPISPRQFPAAVDAPPGERSEPDVCATPRGIVGRSPAVLKLFDDVRRAASVNVNILILGESGVGKELVARATHETGVRRMRPFLPINCAALPESLLEAELFGHERGAFTGAQGSREGLLEAVYGGTLLLDEVSELNTCLQAKLLRAVEEGTIRRVGGRKALPIDVRFIASTNRDIRQEIRRGRFREDLFFRLNVIEIRVPALRERTEDIPLLAAHFLQGCSLRCGKQIEGIAPEAVDLLTRYSWPGNVRELRNAIERAVVYAQGPILRLADLPETVLNGAAGQGGHNFHAWKGRTLERLEREFLGGALADHGGNVSGTARALGVHRSTLQRRLRKYGLPRASAADGSSLPPTG